MVTKRSPGEIIFDIGNAVFLGILTLIFLYPIFETKKRPERKVPSVLCRHYSSDMLGASMSA